MNRHYSWLIGTVAAVMTASMCCATQEFKTAVDRGIWGKVTLTTGDCMPATEDTSKCSKQGAAREVYILRPVKTGDMDSTHLKGKGEVIKQVTPNVDGFYEAELPPGDYSVFVEDGGQKYCNFFGGQIDQVCRVKVADKPERFDIDIDHAAW